MRVSSTDVSSGRDLDALKTFASAEPPPKTPGGHEYLTILYGRPDSRMLVAQDHVRLTEENQECRERVFLFDGEQLVAVVGTPRVCRVSD